MKRKQQKKPSHSMQRKLRRCNEGLQPSFNTTSLINCFVSLTSSGVPEEIWRKIFLSGPPSYSSIRTSSYITLAKYARVERLPPSRMRQTDFIIFLRLICQHWKEIAESLVANDYPKCLMCSTPPLAFSITKNAHPITEYIDRCVVE